MFTKIRQYKKMLFVSLGMFIMASIYLYQISRPTIVFHTYKESGYLGKVSTFDGSIDKLYIKNHIAQYRLPHIWNRNREDEIAIFNRSHWIVYEGNLTTTDSKGKYVLDIKQAAFLRFRGFTWGEDINNSRFILHKKGLSVKSFKSTFYGYIECYNAEREIRLRDLRDYDIEPDYNTV